MSEPTREQIAEKFVDLCDLYTRWKINDKQVDDAIRALFEPLRARVGELEALDATTRRAFNENLSELRALRALYADARYRLEDKDAELRSLRVQLADAERVIAELRDTLHRHRVALADSDRLALELLRCHDNGEVMACWPNCATQEAARRAPFALTPTKEPRDGA